MEDVLNPGLLVSPADRVIMEVPMAIPKVVTMLGRETNYARPDSQPKVVVTGVTANQLAYDVIDRR